MYLFKYKNIEITYIKKCDLSQTVLECESLLFVIINKIFSFVSILNILCNSYAIHRHYNNKYQ